MDVSNRAYSLIEIKSVNEESRVIRGVATTPSTDRMGDVIESRWCETFFGKHLFCGIEQKRTCVLETSLARPSFHHACDCGIVF